MQFGIHIPPFGPLSDARTLADLVAGRFYAPALWRGLEQLASGVDAPQNPPGTAKI